MAMTKTEQKIVEDLQRDLAFRWPTFPCPVRSVAPPTGSVETVGWDYNAHTAEVYATWSGAVSHGRFYNGKRSGGSQGARSLYPTEADAYRAMRWEVCRDMAARLFAIDRKLAAAMECDA